MSALRKECEVDVRSFWPSALTCLAIVSCLFCFFSWSVSSSPGDVVGEVVNLLEEMYLCFLHTVVTDMCNMTAESMLPNSWSPGHFEWRNAKSLVPSSFFCLLHHLGNLPINTDLEVNTPNRAPLPVAFCPPPASLPPSFPLFFPSSLPSTHSMPLVRKPLLCAHGPEPEGALPVHMLPLALRQARWHLCPSAHPPSSGRSQPLTDDQL